jgi:hypothetical protein
LQLSLDLVQLAVDVQYLAVFLGNLLK